jgi:hypothetical protein
MKVLVIGSLPADSKTPASRTLYRDACRDIGKELAVRNWSIGVDTDREDTADALIVEGAEQSGCNIDVNVYYHNKEKRSFQPEGEDEAPRSGFRWTPVPGTWVSGRIPQIRHSDILFLMGGGDKTAPAFIVADFLGKPCLPIPGFGGASGEHWEKFLERIKPLSLNPETNLRGKTEPWRGSASASYLLDFAQQYVKSKPYSARRNPYLFLVLAVVMCSILIWATLFFVQSTAGRLTLLGVLVASSVMGAGLHWLWPLLGHNDTQESSKFFFVRVIIAIIEGFALFLLLLVGAISIDGNVSFLESLSDRPNFMRLAAIASLFGLAAGIMTETIYNSLYTRFEKLFQPSGDDGEGTG